MDKTQGVEAETSEEVEEGSSQEDSSDDSSSGSGSDAEASGSPKAKHAKLSTGKNESKLKVPSTHPSTGSTNGETEKKEDSDTEPEPEEEEPVWNWLEAEQPPEEIDESHKWRVKICIRPDKNAIKLPECCADTEYIVVRGRRGTNQMVNGVYRKAGKELYKRQEVLNGVVTAPGQDAATIFIQKLKDIIWRFTWKEDAEESIGYCSQADENDTPQMLFMPWMMWEAQTNQFEEDLDVRVVALSARDVAEKAIEVEEKRKLSKEERSLVFTLYNLNKTEEETARFLNIHPHSVRHAFHEARKNKGTMRPRDDMLTEEDNRLKAEMKKLRKVSPDVKFSINHVVPAATTT